MENLPQQKARDAAGKAVGVAQQTVNYWMHISNTKVGKAYNFDARLAIPKEKRTEILDRLLAMPRLAKLELTPGALVMARLPKLTPGIMSNFKLEKAHNFDG